MAKFRFSVLASGSGSLPIPFDPASYQPVQVDLTPNELKAKVQTVAFQADNKTPFPFDRFMELQFTKSNQNGIILFFDPDDGKLYDGATPDSTSQNLPPAFYNEYNSKMGRSLSPNPAYSSLTPSPAPTAGAQGSSSRNRASSSPIPATSPPPSTSPATNPPPPAPAAPVQANPPLVYNTQLMEKHYKREPLSSTEQEELKKIPVSAWATFSGTSSQLNSPLVGTSVPEDTILKVTLYLKNSAIKKIRPAAIEVSNSSEVGTVQDVATLNAGTEKITFLFAVISNTSAMDWMHFLSKMKDFLFSTALKQLLPSYVFLETIAVTAFHEGTGLEIVKNLTVVEPGAVENTQVGFTHEVYCLNMYSKLIQAERNAFQIRIPWISNQYTGGDSVNSPSSVLRALLEMLGTNILIQDSNGQGAMLVRLVLSTSRKKVVSRYWPVDSVFPVGFVSSRGLRGAPRKAGKSPLQSPNDAASNTGGSI